MCGGNIQYSPYKHSDRQIYTGFNTHRPVSSAFVSNGCNKCFGQCDSHFNGNMYEKFCLLCALFSNEFSQWDFLEKVSARFTMALDAIQTSIFASKLSRPFSVSAGYGKKNIPSFVVPLKFESLALVVAFEVPFCLAFSTGTPRLILLLLSIQFKSLSISLSVSVSHSVPVRIILI